MMNIGWAWPNWSDTIGGGYTYVTQALTSALADNQARMFRNVLVRLHESSPPSEVVFDTVISADSPIKTNNNSFVRRWFHRPITPDSSTERLFGGRRLNSIIDILVFPYPGFLEEIDLPQIGIVWDLGHRSLSIFPELSHGGNKTHRENFYNKLFKQLDRVIVGTQRGADEAVTYYGYDRSHIGVIPQCAPAYISTAINQAKPLDKKETPFALYPAQFWAHKNHCTLLKAWRHICDLEQFPPRLVLTGHDHGNMPYIEEQVSALNLEKLVEFRGFVDRDELVRLYRAASMLVFPTLLGPDNIPPLEAMACGCPVLVADYPGAREQYGAAARYVAALDHVAWANEVMNILRSPNIATELATSGKTRVAEFTAADFGRRLWEEIRYVCDRRALWRSAT